MLAIDHDLLTTSRTAFDTAGALLGRNVQAAIGEAMRVVGAANKYISDTEPWKLQDDPDRRDTVLHTALQVVSDANTLLTPFLPHAAQQVHEALGGTGIWAAQPRNPRGRRGRRRRTIRSSWATTPPSRRLGVPPDRSRHALVKPTPLFTKLDEKLGKTGPDWAPIET